MKCYGYLKAAWLRQIKQLAHKCISLTKTSKPFSELTILPLFIRDSWFVEWGWQQKLNKKWNFEIFETFQKDKGLRKFLKK